MMKAEHEAELVAGNVAEIKPRLQPSCSRGVVLALAPPDASMPHAIIPKRWVQTLSGSVA